MVYWCDRGGARTGAAISLCLTLARRPSLCFTPAFETLEIQAIRRASNPVFMADEPALQRQPPPELPPQGNLRHLSPHCSGNSRQNRCLQ